MTIADDADSMLPTIDAERHMYHLAIGQNEDDLGDIDIVDLSKSSFFEKRRDQGTRRLEASRAVRRTVLAEDQTAGNRLPLSPQGVGLAKSSFVDMPIGDQKQWNEVGIQIAAKDNGNGSRDVEDTENHIQPRNAEELCGSGQATENQPHQNQELSNNIDPGMMVDSNYRSIALPSPDIMLQTPSMMPMAIAGLRSNKANMMSSISRGVRLEPDHITHPRPEDDPFVTKRSLIPSLRKAGGLKPSVRMPQPAVASLLEQLPGLLHGQSGTAVQHACPNSGSPEFSNGRHFGGSRNQLLDNKNLPSANQVPIEYDFPRLEPRRVKADRMLRDLERMKQDHRFGGPGRTVLHDPLAVQDSVTLTPASSVLATTLSSRARIDMTTDSAADARRYEQIRTYHADTGTYMTSNELLDWQNRRDQLPSDIVERAEWVKDWFTAYETEKADEVFLRRLMSYSTQAQASTVPFLIEKLPRRENDASEIKEQHVGCKLEYTPAETTSLLGRALRNLELQKRQYESLSRRKH